MQEKEEKDEWERQPRELVLQGTDEVHTIQEKLVDGLLWIEKKGETNEMFEKGQNPRHQKEWMIQEKKVQKEEGKCG